MAKITIDITGNGTFTFPLSAEIYPPHPCRISFRKSTATDPVGALVKAGIVQAGLTPELIEDAELTLPTLASTSASLPVRIFADGTVALVVTGFVAPFFADLIQ